MNQAQLVARYGDPGTKRDTVDPAWRAKNLVTRQGARAFPGVPPKWYFEFHKTLEARIEAGFAAAHAACPDYKIERAASFVFRRQRWDTVERAKAEGRPVRQLSDHAFGAAIDVDAAKNRAIEFAAGKAPKPFSAAWKATWPDGLPEKWVRAFCKASRFGWGGDWDPFVDPQHFYAL